MLIIISVVSFGENIQKTYERREKATTTLQMLLSFTASSHADPSCVRQLRFDRIPVLIRSPRFLENKLKVTHFIFRLYLHTERRRLYKTINILPGKFANNLNKNVYLFIVY